MNVFDLFAKITLDDEEYGQQLGEAGKKTSAFSEKLKSGLATAGKAAAAGIAAASAAVAALGKASLESYSEYEQLTGGVETLFKTSSAAVMEYAQNAYKTAGMSANEYMNTVTSFSASLLQSLGGDTEAAAKYADQAITDMSDNANKMGSSMESIQNAYQGFAKQNFTLLDNLKLGYGGTKEEMQRLLEDAEKLSGIEYDISSYADIVDAIHVVQNEMGITGTTAAEASKTISGSVSAAKSAWKNLITGVADENANLYTLIWNFVSSVETAAGNILPRIEQILGGIGSAVDKIFPLIMKKVPQVISDYLPTLLSSAITMLTELVNGLVGTLPQILQTAVQALPQLVEAASTVLQNMATALTSAAGIIVETGWSLLNNLVDGILSGLPDMIERIPQIIDEFLEFVTDKLPVILEKGRELLGKFAFGIIEAIPQMVGKLPDVINSITKFVVENFPKIIKTGGELLGELLAGILGAIPEIAVKLPKVIKAIVDALRAGWAELKNAGKYLLEGLWSGISDKVAWLKGKVSGVVDTIKGWFTGSSGFDTHSPSKWSEKVFRNVMDGGGKGLEAGLPSLMRDVESVTNKVKDGMQVSGIGFDDSGMGRYTSAVNSAISSAGDAPINIVVKSILDGKEIGETSYTYKRNKERMYGLA